MSDSCTMESGLTPNITFEVISSGELNLRNSFRKLWGDQAEWARAAILCISMNLDDTKSVVKRFMRNADDMAQLMQPIYGEAKAYGFKNILKRMLFRFVVFLNKLKRKGTDVDNRGNRYKEYTSEFCGYLSKINPCIVKKDLISLVDTYLYLTEREAVERFQNGVADDIELYEHIKSLAMQIADTISCAVSKQIG